MRNRVWSIALAVCVFACSDADGNGSDAGSGGAVAGTGGSGGWVGGSGGAGGQAGQAGTGGSGGSSGSGGSGGSNASDAAIDAGSQDAGDAGSDSGALSEGPFAVEALPFPVEPGEPIAAPDNQWTYVAFPESRCANGTPTGIAVNPIAGAKGLSIFMQGGGACWDATMCFVSNSSIHLHETVGEPVVLSEAANLSGLFDHANASNPYKDYAYVYIPYCTGDLHIGTREKTYETAEGPQTIHHHGGLNVEAYLERLVATFPDVEHVLVSGISAGGFGATFNWWRYQGAFPNARVDVLDDAGLIVDPAGDRWPTMVDAWAMALPPGCTECPERMSALLPFYGEHLVAPRRYALVGFLSDAVIGSFFGLSGEQIDAQLRGVRAEAAPNQKTFFLTGTQHSIIGEGAFTMASDGSSFLPWLLQLATDDPAWDHAGP